MSKFKFQTQSFLGFPIENLETDDPLDFSIHLEQQVEKVIIERQKPVLTQEQKDSKEIRKIKHEKKNNKKVEAI